MNWCYALIKQLTENAGLSSACLLSVPLLFSIWFYKWTVRHQLPVSLSLSSLRMKWDVVILPASFQHLAILFNSIHLGPLLCHFAVLIRMRIWRIGGLETGHLWGIIWLTKIERVSFLERQLADLLISKYKLMATHTHTHTLVRRQQRCRPFGVSTAEMQAQEK